MEVRSLCQPRGRGTFLLPVEEEEFPLDVPVAHNLPERTVCIISMAGTVPGTRKMLSASVDSGYSPGRASAEGLLMHEASL